MGFIHLRLQLLAPDQGFVVVVMVMVRVRFGIESSERPSMESHLTR